MRISDWSSDVCSSDLHPCAPKSSTKIRPDTTGDTEKGKSMKVMSRLVPGKSNLAIAQDEARPKSTLSGTLMAATRRVSLLAAKASGSMIAAATASMPSFSALANKTGTAPGRERGWHYGKTSGVYGELKK